MRPPPCMRGCTPSPILRLEALEIPDQSDSRTAWLNWVEVNVVDRCGFATKLRGIVVIDVARLTVEHVEVEPQALVQLVGSAQGEQCRGLRALGIVYDERARPEVAHMAGERPAPEIVQSKAERGNFVDGAGNVSTRRVAVREFGA